MADERDIARRGDRTADIYAEWLQESAEFRADYRQRLTVIKAGDMPFENSPDGLLKHMVHEKLNTTECCLDIYMQFIEPGGKSGKSRKLAEQIVYVAEGAGHDLHWDVRFEVDVRVRMELGERAPEIRVDQRRFRLHPRLHDKAARQYRSRQRGAADRHDQPDLQGDGARLGRAGRERRGLCGRPADRARRARLVARHRANRRRRACRPAARSSRGSAGSHRPAT